MKNFQNIILVALLTLVLVACQKENEFDTAINASSVSTFITQDNHTHTGRKCASKAHTEEKLSDPTYRAEHERCLARFERNLQNSTSRSACTTPTILPVAVHYQGVSSTNKACLVNAAKQAVAAMNADFQATNSDIVQWDNNASKYYPNISKGITCLRFEIATKNHPAGTSLSEGEEAVTINKTNGDEVNQWSGYINIYVGDADGNLGYAPLGGSGTGDGVMISKAAFTLGTSCGDVQGQAPNNLGRTLTHEMGHYLNLDHLWGDGGCSSDDGVADTPNQAEENYGCPTLGGTRGCSEEALHMNFMDYPDDACMYMFTTDQARRMEAWVNSGLYDNLKKNVLSEATTNDDVADVPDTITSDDENENTASTDDIGTIGDDYPTDTAEETVIVDEDDSTITVRVTLDDFGSETTFAILDSDYELIAEYGPYEDGEEGRIIAESLDLPTGVYTFLIEDAYGDGICCEGGNGQWELLRNGRTIESSDGGFGYWEEVDFTIGYARLSAPAHRKDQKDLSKLQPKVAASARK